LEQSLALIESMINTDEVIKMKVSFLMSSKFAIFARDWISLNTRVAG
jgi:hypothetical protein